MPSKNSSSKRRAAASSAAAQTLKLSAVAVAVGLALQTPALAQQQQGQRLEEVTVTGSRIQRATGFTSPVPVTAVTPDELTTYAPDTTIADQLDKLPQFFGTQSAQRGGGALFGSAGGSYLNLRAMGPQRTLILLDGNRVVPADRNGNVNVDNFPTALLQNVEVVTGGASAAYGADALAGVTNFILNREYQGLDVSLRGGQTDTGDGQNFKVSVAGGTDLGERWHMIGSIEDQHIDQIQRDPTTLGSWWQRWGLVSNPAWSAGDLNDPQYLVLPHVNSARHSPTGRIAGGFTTDANGVDHPAAFSLTNYQFTYDGTGITTFGAGDVVSPPGGNGAQSGGPEAAIANESFPGGPYGAEVNRRNLFAGFTFSPNDRTQLSFDVLGARVESNQLDQRSIPHGTLPWYMTIYRENPFLPKVVRDQMFAEGVDAIRLEKQGQVLGQDNNYVDHQDSYNEFTTYQMAIGLDQQLNDNWNLKVHLQRGVTNKYTTVIQELRVDKEFLAIDTVSVDPNTGELLGDDPGEDPTQGVYMCNVQRYNPTPAELQASVADVRVPSPQGDASLGGPDELVPIPGPIGPDNVVRDCTPLNVLGQGNASRAAQRYVWTPKAGESSVDQEFAEVLLNGDLWEGYGAGPFAMAAGATYRNQSFWQRGLPVDIMAYGPPLNEPQLGIRGIPPGYTGGSANLHEFSTVPVIKGGYHVWEAFTEFNLPLWESGPRRFELDIAGRYSDYSTSGGINSWKAGMDFAVAAPFRLRGTVSRDVREPTFAERFNLQGGGGAVTDPRDGNIYEITVTAGGNPALDPEKADTVTAGFVYQPQRVQGLQISVDKYRVDLSGAVGQLGQQRIVDGCYIDGNQDLCDLIRLDSTNLIQNVRNVYLNIAKAKVRGIDYEVLFNTEPDFFPGASEALSMRVLAGRLIEDSTTAPGGLPVDNAGAYFEPDFTALATVNYQVGAFGVTLQQRYIPESDLQSGFGQRFAQFEPGVAPPPGNYATVDDATIQSKMYTDLTFAYQQDLSGGQTWRTSLTVQNLFDADPPIVPSFGQRFSSQTTPDNYDTYGRRISLNFDYRF
jgi:iron complex outermembrane receptor protein